MMRIVIDTNVLVSALRSSRGASFALLRRLGPNSFSPIISPPLCVEYEDVLKRPGLLPHLTGQDVDDFLDYFLSQSVECRIHFLWRPFLPDQKDDHVLELALAGGAAYIVTHNVRDFPAVSAFGIQAVTPGRFLTIVNSK